MQFLIDENLPKKLILDSQHAFMHVEEIGTQLTDTEVWEYAKANSFIVITKDTDFYNRMSVHGPPPKVIWVKLGNMRKMELEKCMLAKWPDILKRIKTFDLLEIHLHHIEGLTF